MLIRCTIAGCVANVLPLAKAQMRYAFVFLYILILWVLRWLFAPPESRRLLLVGTVFGAVIIAAILSVEGATWVYLTVIGFWISTLLVLLILHGKHKRREDSIQLLAAMGIFTLALITVIYGINAHAKPSSQDTLGHIVLGLAASGVLWISFLREKSSASQSNVDDTGHKRNPEIEKSRFS